MTGFEKADWFQESISISKDGNGSFLDSPSIMRKLEISEDRKIPLSVQIPLMKSGTYEITVTIQAREQENEILLFLGYRCLSWKGKLKAGEIYTESFLIAVCDIIPRGQLERFEDKTARITLISRSSYLVKVEAKERKGKTLFIAGDSTVTNQSAEYPYAPESSYSGWGQMLPCFLKRAYAVSNHAHSGLTTESFRQEGHYKVMMDYVKNGDICLFQFGHNDQKLVHLQAEGGYKENLKKYIIEVQEKGAIPVLVTPLARNSWKGSDKSYNDLLAEYAESVKRLGEEKNVPVLDLHGRSMDFIIEHGLEDSKRWFYPGDYTHTNDYGAYQMAEFIWDEMKKIHLIRENDMKIDMETAWNPPKEVSLLKLPSNLEKRRGHEDSETLLKKLERPEDILTRAEALAFVISKVNFFPVNVYNDLFEDVIGHEWYAGAVECAIQNEMIPGEMVEGKRFFPEKKITLEEFIYITMTGYQSRKQWSNNALPIEGTQTWTNLSVNAACAMGIVKRNEVWQRTIKRQEAVDILERLKI